MPAMTLDLGHGISLSGLSPQEVVELQRLAKTEFPPSTRLGFVLHSPHGKVHGLGLQDVATLIRLMNTADLTQPTGKFQLDAPVGTINGTLAELASLLRNASSGNGAQRDVPKQANGAAGTLKLGYDADRNRVTASAHGRRFWQQGADKPLEQALRPFFGMVRRDVNIPAEVWDVLNGGGATQDAPASAEQSAPVAE